ncbi:MAG: FimV/HubP family polar landmark protein [Aromatoleum sp.]|jgi:pilus assembly protein FimV|uniref:FimV/HubP family polar landmark protein n=1 Tax=Aromatoleum sp. TaxID=2307007 RepID=UPI0028958A27|nr:FimV/HubP family polar landmark protein [Aromatoleum sp.]MDT3669836.1 FimV/HubP family polar landmark protein [Aromatoleum sp.]
MTAIKTSLKASLIATAIATLPFSTHAAGLGAISVLSGLGQPLRAEIELNATPQELESLSARIASAEAFRQANLSYSPVMAALRLAVEKRGSRAVVRVSSDRPLNDPFVDLLLELDWASGRLIREYTFLLDPVPLNAPPPVASQVTASAVSPATLARPRPSSAAPSPEGAPKPTPDRYEVRRGDTLHSVADAHRPPAASLDQMLIALFRDNPDAFDGGNINRLRAGVILNVPAPQEVLAVEPAQARREVVAQAADFEAYRKRLAGVSASRTASLEPESSRADSGAIVPKIDEGARSGANGDRVKVSAATDSSAQPTALDGGRLARLQALEEELVARDKALEEAHTRLAALEASIRDMQQLLELRNQGLGQLQQQAAQADGAAANPPATPAEAVTPNAETDRQAAASQPAPKAETRAVPASAPAPAEPPGFFDELLQDPKMLAGGGGILVLLLGYAGLKARERRKGAMVAANGQGARMELPPVTNSVFGATGGQNVNTSDTSIIHTDFSQSGLSAIDADEGVDPVAEADVYMAYGRDAQAEEILLDALKADSSRPAIFLKLLEIYEQRKNLKQFEATASDFYARTGGEGSDWQKAAEMGRRIDPANPLYGASVARAAVAATETGAVHSEPGSRVGSENIAGLGVLAAAPAAASEGDEAKLDGGRPDLDFTTAADASVAGGTKEHFGSFEDVPSALQIDSLDMPMTEGTGSPEPEPVIEALPEIDAAALDFDLDVGLGLDVEFPDSARAPDGTPEIDVPVLPNGIAGGLELDLDIADEPAPATVSSMNETVVGDGSDFARAEQSLEFDLSAEVDGAVPESLLADFDLDGAAATGEAAAEERDDSVADLEETTFDSSLLDFDFNLEHATTPSAEEAAVLDLSGIALDLESGGADDGAQTVPPVETLNISTELPPLAVAELNEDALQEVDTKLELARAYDEMGDKDGARELIEEVLREGSADQQAAGRRLLERLA